MGTEPFASLPRVRLVHGPTPIVHHARLSERLGLDLWIKRDDMTGNAEGGNKLRKLEFLLGEARAQGADTVLTCGDIQSNHARATAIVCASIGLSCEVFLRADDAIAAAPMSGNSFLCRLAGAKIRLISKDQYRNRAALMQDAARVAEHRGAKPYVIPEGGSNGLGSLGYVEAMREVRDQLRLGLAGKRGFDLVAVACGSGGTTAGLALGAAMYGVAQEVRAYAVCNDTPYFNATVRRIIGECRAIIASLPEPVPVVVDDTAKGPAYAVPTEAQVRFIVDVARSTGLIFDPVYTGKALQGLAESVRKDGSLLGKRVLFVHTGGVAAALAHTDVFEGQA